jgi:hypothetical protein
MPDRLAKPLPFARCDGAHHPHRKNHRRGFFQEPQKRTGPAYTQYIEATINVPFIGLQTGTRAIDTIVHEHYDGPSIAQAKGLERMYFGKGIGRYRWE